MSDPAPAAPVQTTVSAPVVPTPKRGGIHPIYGVFLGGGPMNDEYHIVSPDFHCVSQLRSIKQLQIIQTHLEQVRDSTTSLKFHGNLDIDDSKAITELDKNHFIKKIECLVETYGFQGFFHMKTRDGKMVSLLSHAHLFTLAEVIDEHNLRMTAHSPVLDRHGIETRASRVTGHGKYDTYDKLDCRISRLAVESVIGTVLHEDIETRYSHLDQFHALPGNVYFMMALEASNASVSHDIDDAVDKFASLSLLSYPGENIKSFATEALRLIKIMEGGYCLPVRLGSDLLRKVYSTSSESFNRWVHSKLDDVRKMELKYKLKDPKLLMNDASYSTLGPIALCGFLQESYGSLITEKAWPALTDALPVSHHTSIISADLTQTPKSRVCYYCKGTDHVKQDCPKLAAKRNRQKGIETDKSITPTTPANSVNPSSGTGTTSFASWRYIEPANPTVAIVMDGVTYKWCKECRCRATGHQGYFTTSHFTSEHIKRNVSFTTPTANHSSLVPLVSQLGDGTFSPDSIPPEERLVFTGPWHCEVALQASVDMEQDPYVPDGAIDS